MSRELCIIALGSNLESDFGAPHETLLAAIDRLPAHGLTCARIADFFRTPAYPEGAGPDFINGAVEVKTDLSPEQALAALHEIESAIGRRRDKRYGPRTADLDIICWADRVAPDARTVRDWIDLPEERWTRAAPDRLLLPHPRLQDRAFVLAPLCDLAPDWRHPLLDRTAAELLAARPEAERAAMRRLPT